MLAAVAIALAAWLVEGRQGWPVDAIVIALVIVLNGALGYAQEAKADSAVAALAGMTSATCSVLRDGKLLRIASADLVVDDLLVLGEGDLVGADARLVRAAALRVQEASLTGESEAVLKDTATLPRPAPLGDRLNMVFKGTAVAQGTGLVTATGTMNSSALERDDVYYNTLTLPDVFTTGFERSLALQCDLPPNSTIEGYVSRMSVTRKSGGI